MIDDARLKELIEADERGRLFISPIAIGQSVYSMTPFKSCVLEYTVKEIDFFDRLAGLFRARGDSSQEKRYELSGLGIKWFYTREEAEEALKTWKSAR